MKFGSFITAVGASSFTLLSGDDVLGTYQFGSRSIERRFCKSCSVLCFSKITAPDGEQVGINLNTLDDVELKDLPVVYFDGRHDDFTPRSEPAPVRRQGEPPTAGAAS
jgi:hypothetical protein